MAPTGRARRGGGGDGGPGGRVGGGGDRGVDYTGSAVPGDPGRAVLAGHVDTRRGPAAFGRLDRLRPGDPVEVARSDGGVARFTVDSVEYHAEDGVPTERVYGPTTRSGLRPLTCSGPFAAKRLSYRDNVVVFASRR